MADDVKSDAVSQPAPAVIPPEVQVVKSGDGNTEIAIESKPEDKVNPKKEEIVPFGVRANTVPPEESPLNTNGYTGVDPNFQRGPLSE